MITFDLECDSGHKFEGWFAGREEFERQLEAGLIACPLCDSRAISRRPSAFTVARGEPAHKEGERPPAAAFFRELSDFVQNNFEDLGADFAKEALRIKAGEAPGRSIRGTTTEAEEETLAEEGVEFLKVALPKYDA